MRINELIETLEDIRKAHGNLDVMLIDHDKDWYASINEVAYDDWQYPEKVVIK